MTTTALELPVAAATPSARRRGRGPALALSAARRVLGGLIVILCVITVTFLVTRVFAPDPTNLFLGGSGNGFASAAAEAAARVQVRASLGLDKPLIEQYFIFLGHVVQGNLGESFQTGQPVSGELFSRLPATAELAVYALLVGVTLGIGVGVLAAVRPGGWFDRIGRLFTIGAIAMPQFWIGLMLLWLLSVKWHLLPGPTGRLSVGEAPPRHLTGFYVIDGLLTGQWSLASSAALHLILPVVTLALGLAAPIAKVTRTSMREALSADYIRTAAALGFGNRRIWFGYALKNGLLPVVTILAGIVAFTLCGSILVEGIFGWPGIGNYSLQAIRTSDFPVIQGFVLYAAVLYVVLYEGLAIVYGYIDPRTRS
jgi:ABC-type dipeptide/oligopeptide/nickel transport system permease component